MKNIVKKLLATFDLRLSRLSTFERENAFEAQARLIQGQPSSSLTIFDVGAYKGDIALRYNQLFPNAHIFCFEPFAASFDLLQKNVASYRNIKTYPLGLGETDGKAIMHSNSFAVTNSLLATHETGSSTWGTGLLETQEVVDVDLTTLDQFVEQNQIKQIDILKLDAQGAEYLILEGGKQTLKQGLVKMIYTEIITLPTYEKQKSLGEVLQLLEEYGFELFNFYNNDLNSNGQLRQVDAIFIQKT